MLNMDRYSQHIRNLGFGLRLTKLESQLSTLSPAAMFDFAFELFADIEDAAACEEINTEQREALVGRLHMFVPELV